MKPILFKSEMIRSILDGRKLQTRRAIKPQPPEGAVWDDDSRLFVLSGSRLGLIRKCPYGHPGDLLWVREAWATEYLYDDIKPSKLTPRDSDIYYKADGIDSATDVMVHRWRPSIFMPRWASRITLEITDVSVERVQDIDIEDAFHEGYPLSWANAIADGIDAAQSIEWFRDLWDSINAKRGYGWAINPWVWIVSFGVAK